MRAAVIVLALAATETLREREEEIRAERRVRVTIRVCAPVLLHARGAVR